MCGILFTLAKLDRPPRCRTDGRLLDHVRHRGPDSLVTYEVVVGDLSLSFTSSVLHLRGPQVVPQPIVDKGNILCWNGEAWDGLDCSVTENDTLALSRVLARQDIDILRVFENIRGPYAFVYYQVVNYPPSKNIRSYMIRRNKAKSGMVEIFWVGDHYCWTRQMVFSLCPL